MKRLFGCMLWLGAASFSPLAVADSATNAGNATPPATAPSSQPAGAPALKSGAKVSPEAQALLDDLKAAYAKLDSLDLAGSVSFHSDVAGKKDIEYDTFESSFQAPNRFRHEMKGNMLAGSTGEKAYVQSLEENSYIQKDAPKERIAAADAPKAVWDVIATQNPSLALAVSRDAAAQIVDGAAAFALVNSRDFTADGIVKATEIKKIADVTLGEKTCPALMLTNPWGDFTYVIDPESHLLRGLIIDQKKFIQHVGQPDVVKATTIFEYGVSTINAPVKEKQFAWVPPVGARELSSAPAMADAGGESPLVGKPAPAFKLAGPDGKEVSLADQKGSVVVVDFWATWCGPCVESLPHLNQLYVDKKAAGLKVFAVSVDEDKSKVPPFLEQHKLVLPVLLDNDEQKVAQQYGVQGIPQTVVIGKDGLVKKVFIGFGPGSSEALLKVVEEAMK